MPELAVRRIFASRSARPRSVRKRELAVVAVACCAVLSGVAFRVANLTVNTSPSEPMGVWHLAPSPSYQLGDVVSACLPATAAVVEAHRRGYILSGHCAGGIAPVLKPIAAMAGDTVTIDTAGVRVNGQWISRTPLAKQDAQGRPLYPAFYGSVTIQPGHVFLASDYSARSYDSRYFGEVPLAGVRYKATPVLMTHWKPEGY